jgi:hypothetical protein
LIISADNDLIPIGDDFGFSESLWKWQKNLTN